MASELFDRSVVVSASPEVVWNVVTDVDRLVSWINVVHSVNTVRDLEAYTAVLEDRVGPLKLRADLEINLVIVRDGRNVEVTASGRDRAMDSRIEVNASVDLVPSAEGSDLSVKGGYQVTGRAARLGTSIIQKKARRVLDDFFDNLRDAFGPGGERPSVGDERPVVAGPQPRDDWTDGAV